MNQIVIDESFLQQLELLELLVKNNIAGQFGGNHKTRTYGSSCEFADYRDYIPGDDISKIDWNAYARFEKLYLKLFLDERQMHTKIYIDASRSMAYGGSKKDVQAIKIAAAIAYLSVSQMDKVSIFIVKDKTCVPIISGVLGKESYLNVINALNAVEFDGDSYISEAIVPTPVGYGDGVSVIISDFLTDNDFTSVIDHLASKRRDILCVQVLSEDELNPKDRGKMHFFDSENIEKEYRKNINREIIKAYKSAVDYATSRIREYCLARGGSYLLASSTQDIQSVFYQDFLDMGVLK